MPRYTSVGAVNSLFPPISSVTALTSGVVAHYIDTVEAEIEARLTKRYAIPVTPIASGATVPLLSAIAERETVYRIAVTRGLVQFPAAQQGQQPLAIQHKEDQQLLQQIVEGMIHLIDSTGQELPVDTSQLLVFSTTQGYNPTFADGLPFTEDVVDTNKSDDQAADREGAGL